MSESLMIKKRAAVFDRLPPVKKSSGIVCIGQFFVTGNRGKRFLDDFRWQQGLQKLFLDDSRWPDDV